VAVLWECGNRAVCDFQGRRDDRGKLDVERRIPVTRDESFPRSLPFPSFPQRSLSSINWWLSLCGSVLAGPVWPSAFVGRPECRSFAAPGDPVAQGECLPSMLLPVVQRAQLFVRRAIVLSWVGTFSPSSRVGSDGGKPAWPVEVQVGVQMHHVEFLKLFGMLGRDQSVPDLLANHGAVFPLHQCVVGAPVRPRFGELHQQFVQQRGYCAVQELRSVVAVRVRPRAVSLNSFSWRKARFERSICGIWSVGVPPVESLLCGRWEWTRSS